MASSVHISRRKEWVWRRYEWRYDITLPDGRVFNGCSSMREAFGVARRYAPKATVVRDWKESTTTYESSSARFLRKVTAEMQQRDPSSVVWTPEKGWADA